ncbi:MAG: hypothetical protein QG577_654 [Thermodesulfobacteriota bacterium]|nr:hypothetical protein [Thermodesulfobacteriota bacterium]
MNDDTWHTGPRNLGKLFLTAILSKSRVLNLEAKLRLITAVPEFDIDDEEMVAHYVRPASSPTKTKKPLLRYTTASQKEAAQKARVWGSRGVFILRADGLATKRVFIPNFPSMLFAWGNPAAAANPTAAILCSRQSLARLPHSSFLEALKSIVSLTAQAGDTIVSSYGTAGYNAVTTLNRGSLTIVVCPGALPFMDDENRLQEFLNTHNGFFDLQNTLFVTSTPPKTTISAAEGMFLRDRIVAGLSETLFAVDVRPGGNMEKIIGYAMKSGVSVQMVNTMPPRRTRQRVRLVPNHSGEGYVGIHSSTTLGHGPLRPGSGMGYANSAGDGHDKPGTHTITPPDVPPFLYHYTKSAPGPWPGQSLAEYWNSLLNNDPHSGHSGRDTLCKILSEQRIRGSDRLIRTREPVVCFSELPPEKLSSIMRWRRGLRSWSVEPYGVGIHAAILAQLGAKPVTYGLPDEYHAMPSQEKYLFQVSRSKGYRWAGELEWRLRGDLCFAHIPHDKVVVVAASKEDVTFLRSRFNYQIICWETLVCIPRIPGLSQSDFPSPHGQTYNKLDLLR